MSLALVQDPSRRIKVGSIGAAVFMLTLGALDLITRGAISLPAMVPPFGASVVIVFFTPEVASAKPWNVLVGHTGSAFVAAVVLWSLPQAPVSVQAALAVVGAGLLMLVTRSVHPPGGATALLAVVAEKKLGFAMVLCPMLTGAALLVATRLLLDLSLGWIAQRASAPCVELEPLAQPAAESIARELDAA